jgi:hypothetical protein
MSAHAHHLIARAEVSQARRGEPTPLSQSPLWRLQRRYFEQVGIRAWRDNVVPSFITSNAFIADAYARLAAGYLADLPPGQPLTILEIGAGAGRFAHFFLRRFFGDPATARSFPAARYVLTDVSEANIEFCRAHEKFAPFVERGLLDFARFDATTQDRLQLRVGGKTLAPQPTMAIANYVFDSLEQDLFEASAGQLFELWTSLDRVEAGLAGIEVRHHKRPHDPRRYPDPQWRALLSDYASAIHDGAFLFPVGAARVLDNLRRLAPESLLVVAADKGVSRIEALRGAPRPSPTRHGSVSFAVNFHALAALTRQAGGDVLQPPHASAALHVMGFAFGAADLPQTRRAYADAIANAGPDDLFQLKKGMETAYSTLTLSQMTAFLRVMRWDPSVILGLYGPLADALAQAPAAAQAPIFDGLMAAWAQYLPLSEADDLAFCLGNMMAAMRRYEPALVFFEVSRTNYGDNDATRTNIDLCRRLLSEEG